MSEPVIAAATIAKDRSWSLTRWLSALAGQTRPPDYAFVLLNDTSDDSKGLLYSLSKASLMKPELAWDELNTGDKGVDRVATPDAPRYSTANLAMLRNAMIERVLSRWPACSHILSCDSDVACDPDVLEKLLAADLPVVAAVVRNSTAEVWNFGCALDELTSGEIVPARSGAESSWLETREPFRVFYTGASVLVRRDVAERVRYVDHRNGEDMAWSLEAARFGYSLYVHPLARTRHVQRSGEVWR